MDTVGSVRDGLLSAAVDMSFALQQKNAQVSVNGCKSLAVTNLPCFLMLCLLSLDLENAMRTDKQQFGCVGVIVA